MERGNRTPKTSNADPFTKSLMTPRSPNQKAEDIILSDSEKDINDEEETCALMETRRVNNVLTNSRIIINTMKTTLSEGKGKIIVSQKEKLNEGMEELFDIIAHLVAENNEFKGELKILRPLTKQFIKNFDEVKKVMQENKSLFITMDNKNEEIKKDLKKK